jgi:hypothetical protein
MISDVADTTNAPFEPCELSSNATSPFGGDSGALPPPVVRFSFLVPGMTSPYSLESPTAVVLPPEADLGTDPGVGHCGPGPDTSLATHDLAPSAPAAPSALARSLPV